MLSTEMGNIFIFSFIYNSKRICVILSFTEGNITYTVLNGDAGVWPWAQMHSLPSGHSRWP